MTEVKVARIGKPHGIRGEVTVELFTDDPQSRFAPGSVLRCQGAGAGPDRLEVASSRWNKNVLVVRFTAVTDRNQAEGLRGTVLHGAPRAEETEEDEQWYEHELLGLAVHDTSRPDAHGDPAHVGTVSGLITYPHQDVLQVDLRGGGQASIPFVEEIVTEIDPERGLVRIDPPAGLLQLQLEDSADGTGSPDRAESQDGTDSLEGDAAAQAEGTQAGTGRRAGEQAGE